MYSVGGYETILNYTLTVTHTAKTQKLYPEKNIKGQ